jgi:hypothetical protein
MHEAITQSNCAIHTVCSVCLWLSCRPTAVQTQGQRRISKVIRISLQIICNILAKTSFQQGLRCSLQGCYEHAHYHMLRVFTLDTRSGCPSPLQPLACDYCQPATSDWMCSTVPPESGFMKRAKTFYPLGPPKSNMTWKRGDL